MTLSEWRKLSTFAGLLHVKFLSYFPFASSFFSPFLTFHSLKVCVWWLWVGLVVVAWYISNLAKEYWEIMMKIASQMKKAFESRFLIWMVGYRVSGSKGVHWTGTLADFHYGVSFWFMRFHRNHSQKCNFYLLHFSSALGSLSHLLSIIVYLHLSKLVLHLQIT